MSKKKMPKYMGVTPDYDKVKRYDFARKCYAPNPLFKLIAKSMADSGLKGRTVTVKKTNMEGLKTPYLILGHHKSFFDLNVLVRATYPTNLTYVCAIDAMRDHGEFIMRHLGIIGKRKFIQDVHLLRNMKRSVTKLKNSALVLYPEAKFTFDGTTSYIPDTIGKLVKFLGVPVVVANMMGNYITQPQWSKNTYEGLPLEVELKQIITEQQLKTLNKDQLQELVEKGMEYNEYDFQKEKGILITAPDRAEGLDKVLYRCPACHTDFSTETHGTELKCTHCGKSWQLNEDGTLSCEDGDPIFTTIPDWFDYEQAAVKKEVEEGTYRIETTAKMWTLPNAQKFYAQEDAKIVHDVQGFHLVGTEYKRPLDKMWKGIETDGLHIEFNYKDFGDVIDISTPDESYWLAPYDRNVCMKMSLAVDEIFKLESQKVRKGKK